MVARPAVSVAPIWRDTCASGWIEQLGGASAGRAKLLAGTLRCLRLCWLLPFELVCTEEQLGRCPKPHQGRCPWTPQGADEKGRSPPLTLFLRPGLVALPYNKCPGSFLRCRGVSFIPFPLFLRLFYPDNPFNHRLIRLRGTVPLRSVTGVFSQIASTTSIPLMTLPNAAYCPSKCGASACVMKNWLPAVSIRAGPRHRSGRRERVSQVVLHAVGC